MTSPDPTNDHASGRYDEPSSTLAAVDPRDPERGAAVVEWLGISALSIAMIVVMFAALQQVGLDLVNDIRGSLGL